MSVDAIFVQDGDRFTATDLALGPWAPGMLHGGAAAALLLHAFCEAAPAGLQPARVTYEFLRPVPQGPLTPEVSLLRAGRRVTLLDGVLRDGDGDGADVTRARALFMVPSDIGVAGGGPPPFPGPSEGEPSDWALRATRMFASHGMEIRFIEGHFREPGPATAWFRLRYPLIAGGDTAPVELLAAAGDFGNGIASVLSWDEHVFINADLTLYIEREPAGEWVALQSETRVAPGSVAVADSTLWDERGRIGRAVQSIVVGQRPT